MSLSAFRVTTFIKRADLFVTGKGLSDKQHNNSSGDNARPKKDDPAIIDKVRQVMDMTRRSEEEVCLALYECDNDAERAINMLYENMTEVSTIAPK